MNTGPQWVTDKYSFLFCIWWFNTFTLWCGSRDKSCSQSRCSSVIKWCHHVIAPVLITSGQEHQASSKKRGTERRRDGKEELKEKWTWKMKDERMGSRKGGGKKRADQRWNWFSQWMHLKFFRNFDTFSHSWGLLPGTVLQKRFRLHNPLLPEKLSEKRTREAQLIVLYTGIALTCCLRPVSTRHSACGGQCVGRVGITERVWYTFNTIDQSQNQCWCWYMMSQYIYWHIPSFSTWTTNCAELEK